MRKIPSSVRIISGGNDRTQLFMGVLLTEPRFTEVRGREKGRADLPGLHIALLLQ